MENISRMFSFFDSVDDEQQMQNLQHLSVDWQNLQ